jgi:hypothetical protein
MLSIQADFIKTCMLHKALCVEEIYEPGGSAAIELRWRRTLVQFIFTEQFYY